MTQGKSVARVEPGSIAEELGINPGDRIVAMNEMELSDILDWNLAESSEELILAVLHNNGELVEYEIEKDYDESLGIVFNSPTLDKIRSCQNRCVFCFVDQLPAQMRETLYLKDDDYRLSFLSGSYVTLTNMEDADLERIESLHLSPLYVSVHTTDAILRQQMMNHSKADQIMPLLQRLTKAGIDFHTQVVLCPGINDEDHLDKTIADLYSLYPGVKSLAVVPVGLTDHRRGLYPLSPFAEVHAQNVLQQLATWQERCQREQGTGFVFASDEFYNMANAQIPPDQWYEGYPQLENGVGLIRLLQNEWEQWQTHLPSKVNHTNATIATGISAYRYLKPIIDRLNTIVGLTLDLVPVQNRYFGGHVSVAGLLTYQDLLPALQNRSEIKILYLPAVMLKEGKNLFLDGHNIDDLSRALNANVRVVSDLNQFLTDLLESEMR